MNRLGTAQLPKQGARWELAGFGSSSSTIPELSQSLRGLHRLCTDPVPSWATGTAWLVFLLFK